MKHIVFLYLDGRLAFAGFAYRVVGRLREDFKRVPNADALVAHIKKHGEIYGYEARVIDADASMALAAE